MRTLALLSLLLTAISHGQNASTKNLLRELSKEHKPEDLVTVSGTVVNSVTGDPVPRAKVSAAAVGMPIGALSNATSDTSGSFTLTGLPPGSYTLYADRPGFVQNRAIGFSSPSAKRNRVHVSAGDRLSGVRVLIVPQAVVTGRVLDTNGDPVSNALVMAQPVRRSNRALQNATQTNDLGEYRLFGIEPGRYVVSVDSRPESVQPRAMLPNLPAQGPREQAVRTYYPRTIEESEASSLLLKPGDIRQGIDIQQLTARLATVSGRVVLPPNWRNPTAVNLPPGMTAEAANNLPVGQVSISPLKSVAGPVNRSGAAIKPNGEFVIDGIVPGTYRLTAHLPSSPSSATNINRLASATVEVRGGNVENVVLVFRELVPAVATLKFENSSSNAQRVTLNLVPLNGMGGAFGHFDPQKGAQIRFSPVEPGSYRLTVTDPGCECYLKSLQVNGRDVENGIIEIGDASDTAIQLTFREPAAHVEGSVKDREGKQAIGYSVVLWPESNKRPDLYKLAQTDAEGKYNFNGVAPGRYFLVAFPSMLWTGAWSLELDSILEELVDKAEKVTLDEQGRLQKDLRAAEDDQ